MTPQQIYDRCTSLEKTILDKGYVKAEVWFAVNYLTATEGKCCVWVEYKSGEYATREHETFYSDPDNPEGAFGQCFEHIAKLKSIDEKKRDDFLKALGRVIDQGRDCDIEVEFLNPLEAAMKKLSENILEAA